MKKGRRMKMKVKVRKRVEKEVQKDKWKGDEIKKLKCKIVGELEIWKGKARAPNTNKKNVKNVTLIRMQKHADINSFLDYSVSSVWT